MKAVLLSFVCVLVLACLASCSRLSSRAKEIVGNYYIPELSEDDPLMELNGDASCRIRAIRPGVLTYSVDGTWNVKKDSLVIDLDPVTLAFEGDSTLIGHIPAHIGKYVADYSGITLTLIDEDGIEYVYHRRQNQ